VTGTIKFMHAAGWGRITTDDGEKLFFCASAVSRESLRRFDELRVGDRVTIASTCPTVRGAEAWGVRFHDSTDAMEAAA
jgi:cold shock CspA family protein